MANRSPVTIVGNLTADPEQRSVGQAGALKTTFSVAVNHPYKKDDEWVENTSFFNVVAWRQLAEQAAVLEKGVRVIVTGRLDQRSWETDDGGKRSTVEVLADEIGLSVGGVASFTRRTREGAGQRPRPGGGQQSRAATVPEYDEEPF